MTTTLYVERQTNDVEIQRVLISLRTHIAVLHELGDTFDRELEKLERDILELAETGTPISNPNLLRHRTNMRREVIGPSIDVEIIDRHGNSFRGHVARTRIFLTADALGRNDQPILEMCEFLRDCGAASVEIYDGG